MDKAVNYVLNRRDTAETYLEDGRCSFTNNLSENAIRPFAVGRKNWLFSSSVEGANASAVVYTMVEMAKANGLNIYEYLKFLLEHRPSKDMADEQLAELAPWSENEKRMAQVEGFKAKLYENLVSGILTKEEFLSYKRKYNADIELLQKAVAEWNEKLTDVLENRSERNRWINHFMQFSTMEEIDRRAVMQLIRSIRVMGKDELHIEFNYQDEYQKAVSLAEQIAVQGKERKVG